MMKKKLNRNNNSGKFGSYGGQFVPETLMLALQELSSYYEAIKNDPVFIEEFNEIGVKQVIEESRRVVGDGPVYLSFDVDGLDPVYAPGTGTPEVGGITTLEAQQFLRGLMGLDFVGGDVVEVAPPFDQTGNTALVGATIMYEILCLFADRFKNK